MMKDQLANAVRNALVALEILPAGDPLLDRVEVSQPQSREHGDWATNAALVTSKAAGRNPREVAADLVAHMEANPPRHLAAMEIAGPGFINFRLQPGWLHDVLSATATSSPDDFGAHHFGDGTHINVEFVSANPNGPLHGGHARGAIYGDAMARLFAKCGYQVTREDYLNDRGVQMKNYTDSLVAARAGEPTPEDGYAGQYVTDWANEIPAEITEWQDVFAWGYARALQSHKDTLAAIQVHHDVFFSERSLMESGAVESVLDRLAELDKSFEADGATWLRSTDFGDDKDRVLIKSDGDLTYLTPDVAYHEDKFSRADKLFNVWGADHHSYVVRMKAAMQALGHQPDDLEIVVTQLVKLERDGVEEKMAKRTGEFVTIDEMVSEVGADAVRFTFLMQSMDTRQTIDLTALSEKSMDNPVFYVQYAHARIKQLGKNAAEAGVECQPLDRTDLSVLTHDRELEVLRVLNEYPEQVAIACRERAPHRITTWSRELASAFHGFYRDCYVVGHDVTLEQTQARLWLIEAARVGLVSALELVGVSAPDQM